MVQTRIKIVLLSIVGVVLTGMLAGCGVSSESSASKASPDKTTPKPSTTADATPKENATTPATSPAATVVATPVTPQPTAAVATTPAALTTVDAKPDATTTPAALTTVATKADATTTPDEDAPASPDVAETPEEMIVTMYKPGTCNCCVKYAEYLRENGYTVNIKIVPDIGAQHKKLGVPDDVVSCHTDVIGPYIVEGHVPLPAIRELMKKKPDIKGIALPAMPAGSPGMPGWKMDHFTIYAIQKDGSTSVFMTL